MALRKFCVRLAPDFLHQTRASVGNALHGLSRCSFSTDGASGANQEAGASGSDLPKVQASPSSRRGGGGGDGAGRKRRSVDEVEGNATPKLKLESVSPYRVYYPGQSYETDDLAPRLNQYVVEAFTPTQKSKRGPPMRGKEIDKQLIETLDFRNARLLSQFVSETGKILPKRKTGLSAKVHRKMTRQVKVSRVMGIMPFTERLKGLGIRKS